MTTFKYYRGCSREEARALMANDQYTTNLTTKTYWTNNPSAASLYARGAIICIELDRDIPQGYHGVAEGVDDNGYMNNHHEVVMSRSLFNDVLCNMIEIEVL